MTPNEAIDELRRCAAYVSMGAIDTHGSDMETLAEYTAAMNVLAHYTTPRTEPPTLEEVGDRDWCLVRFIHTEREWCNYTGHFARRYWGEQFDLWLPIPAVTE
jgi:hypothetical protein